MFDQTMGQVSFLRHFKLAVKFEKENFFLIFHWQMKQIYRPNLEFLFGVNVENV